MHRFNGTARWVCGLVPLTSFPGTVGTVDAAIIHYGDFGPDYPPGGVTHVDVTESSGTDPSPLSGPPTLTAVTSVAAGVSIDIDILEVGGVALASPISVFASSSTVRDLVTDGPVVLAPWSGGWLIEFAPVLVANNIGFDLGVTMAGVVIDDFASLSGGNGEVDGPGFFG